MDAANREALYDFKLLLLKKFIVSFNKNIHYLEELDERYGDEGFLKYKFIGPES
jgi:hypothetical protein